MKERLMQLLKNLGFSATRFADEIDVQRSGISHILSGRNQPSFDFLVKILNRFPDINADWLITGKGKMFKTETTIPARELEKAPKSYPVKEEINLFSMPGTNLPINDTNNKAVAKVTSVTSVNQIIVLHTDGTFDIYQQAIKE